MLLSVTTVALCDVTVVKPWDNKQQSVTGEEVYLSKQTTYATEYKTITMAITGRTRK